MIKFIFFPKWPSSQILIKGSILRVTLQGDHETKWQKGTTGLGPSESSTQLPRTLKPKPLTLNPKPLNTKP